MATRFTKPVRLSPIAKSRRHCWTFWQHFPMGGFWFPDDRLTMTEEDLPREPFLTILLQPSRQEILRQLRWLPEDQRPMTMMEMGLMTMVGRDVSQCYDIADWLEHFIWKGRTQ